MLCKCYKIVLYIVHFTAFCLGGRFFPVTVYIYLSICLSIYLSKGLYFYGKGLLGGEREGRRGREGMAVPTLLQINHCLSRIGSSDGGFGAFGPRSAMETMH